MELSQEKKTQIAACHGKGMTVKEIAKAAKLTEGQVDVFLQSIGKRPLYRRYSQTKKDETEKKYNRVTDEQKKEIFELLAQGKGCTEISKSTGISIKTIEYYKKKLRKEKEPATAATVTDSMDTKTGVCDTVSISKDNTIEPKSQVLLIDIRKRLLTIYETLGEKEQLAWDLGEMYAAVKEGIGDENTET